MNEYIQLENKNKTHNFNWNYFVDYIVYMVLPLVASRSCFLHSKDELLIAWNLERIGQYDDFKCGSRFPCVSLWYFRISRGFQERSAASDFTNGMTVHINTMLFIAKFTSIILAWNVKYIMLQTDNNITWSTIAILYPTYYLKQIWYKVKLLQEQFIVDWFIC